MGGYNYQTNHIPVKSSSLSFPFEIQPWTGDIPDGATQMYMVTTGDCYKTFSYAKEEMITISGLYSGFEWKPNQKVYIEFPIIGGYRPSGVAFIKCSEVGKAAGESDDLVPEKWEDFPLMFRYTPKDEEDENGYVKRIFDGKRQTVAYLLVGVRSDDLDTQGLGGESNGGESQAESFEVVQKVNTNLIMMMSQYRGMPVSFPMPWFGGPDPSGVNFKSS